MSNVGKLLVACAYTLFLAVYVYAAFAYGLTRTRQIGPFEYACAAMIFLWLAGHLLQRKLPRTGAWPWILSVSILGFGWLITGLGWLNDVLDSDAFPTWAGQLPSDILFKFGTQDPDASISAMFLTTALLGAMLMAIDFWSDPSRARGILWTMILSSSGMVFLFFLQKIVGAPFLLMSEDGQASLAFATYRYHGNAAAYLDLFWPVTAAVAIFAVIRQHLSWPFWFIPLAATVLAAFLNVSKAGNVLAPVGIVLMLLTLIPYFKQERKRSKHPIRRSRLLVALVPVLVIAVSIPFALPWKRWHYFAETADLPGGRTTAYGELVKMIPDAGTTGFGPGTFPSNSLGYTSENPHLKQVWFRFAHEDYLQTIIEWGYIGACLWAFLLVPPFFLLFAMARRSSKRLSREFEGYRIGAFDHLKAFFQSTPGPREACVAAGAFTAVALTAMHATFDFPMQIASLQFFFLTLLALGWSYRMEDRAPVEAP